MALSFDLETQEKLSLDEYVEHIEQTVDFDDPESIAASAPALRKLLNDRRLMVDVVNRQLLGALDDNASNTYTAQVFMLARRQRFGVRANIWVPVPAEPEAGDNPTRAIYFYEVPHDHNFTFMTGGYVGSGYRTLIYEYDYDSVVGEPGEAVDLRFLEHTSLPQNKIMLYRPSTDVHSQEQPDELSVSINLMVNSQREQARNQYFFDLEKRCITDYVESRSAGSVFMCHVASVVGDDRTASLLHDLSRSSSMPRVRAESFLALARMAPSDIPELVEQSSRDAHAFVRTSVQRALLGAA